MLRPEEFGSLGCVKEAHGGGHAEIRKSSQREGGMMGREVLFYDYGGQLVRGQVTKVYDRAESSFKTVNMRGKANKHGIFRISLLK